MYKTPKNINYCWNVVHVTLCKNLKIYHSPFPQTQLQNNFVTQFKDFFNHIKIFKVTKLIVAFFKNYI